MSPEERLKRLRRQRNLFGGAAVLIVLVGLAVALPRNLERRGRLKAANTELLQLQAELAALQQQIVQVQDQIRAVQVKIREVQKPHP